MAIPLRPMYQCSKTGKDSARLVFRDPFVCFAGSTNVQIPRKFYKMADPALERQYPVRGLYQALAIAAMCVQEQPNMLPLIADVVIALNYLASQTYDHSTVKRDGEQKSPRARDLI
ncbi:putative serine/threonine-protein kinase PBL7 [Forsythia ovata]|uniref:Serine/threonine-protein kinase PBL7 n=1 Tax=Forsythia ovata TaxID=205694 RepID=A0ABD1W6P1_9LAMI